MPQIEINYDSAGWSQALDPKYRYIFIKGGRSCVAGDTRIDTLGGKIPIKDFKGGYVYAWDGEKKVIAAAYPSECMGKEHIFEITLDNGNKIQCTPSHKFLTNFGWKKCHQVGAGDRILSENTGFFSSLLGSSWESFLLMFPSSVQHWTQKRVDSLVSYLLYRRPYGQRPLFVSDTVLAFSPQQGDALQHNCHALCRLGGRVSQYIYNLSCILRRPSMWIFPHAGALQSCVNRENHIGGKSFAQPLVSCLEFAQSHLCDTLSCIAQKTLEHHQGFGLWRHRGKTPQKVRLLALRALRGIFLRKSYCYSSVRLVKYIGLLDYYDIHVPIYNNYFAHGFVNHNSGKSHEVANYLVERSFTEKDLKIVGLREVQKSIDKSSKSLVDNKIKSMGLQPYYKSIQSEIRKELPGDDGHFYFQGMNDLTADNIKSLEDYRIAWFEEAQNCTANTLKVLRPTIRAKGSQIIFTWNPKFPDDAIEELCNDLRNEPDTLVIHVNYTDNPFLTDEVKREIEIDRAKYPDDFPHIWLGEYDTSFHGHYYAKLLDDAANEGRITEVPRKAGVDIACAWDLGRADATAIWVAQVVGLQVRIIDHIEDNFKDLDYYADWIKDNGYNGLQVLPHDAAHERLARQGKTGSIQEQLRDLGLTNSIIQQAGSLDATRKLAKNLIREAWIDADKCRIGINALRHEKSEKDRNGRWKETHEHDSAAAFRYLAMYLNRKPPVIANKPDPYNPRKNPYASGGYGGTGWMGA